MTNAVLPVNPFVLMLGCVTTLALTTGATVVYQNDFSTRTSSKGIPSARWQYSDVYVKYGEKDDLFRPYIWSGDTVAYAEPSAYQDGWIKAFDGYLNDESSFCLSEGIDGDGNQFGYFKNASANPVVDPTWDHRTFALQHFYNSISNGILRMQVDIRAAKYDYIKNNNIFVGPVFEKYQGFNWSKTLPAYPGMFGVNMDQDLSPSDSEKCHLMSYSYGGKGKSGNEYVDVRGSKLIIGNWYRFVMDFNLDNNTLSGKVYAMGSTTPTLKSTGTLMDTLSSVHFYSDMDLANLGPITGFCIRDCGSSSGDGANFDSRKSPALDNIRCSWRPSGTDFSEDDLFYENDFTIRRLRSIVPESPKSFTYVPVTATPTNVFNSYPVYAQSSLPQWESFVPSPTGKKEAQPYGVDGWRRINGTAGVKVSVTVTNGNNMVAAVYDSTDNNRYGIIAQTLGKKITSGQVRLSIDVHTPDKWRMGSSRMLYAMLAPENYLNSGTDTEQTTLYAARLGIKGNSDTELKFATMAASDSTGNSATPNHWYRLVMTIDITNRKMVESKIYDIGENAVALDYEPTGDPVFSGGGVGLKNANLQDISCFAVFLGSCGDSGKKPEQLIFFDNIKVWKRAGTEGEWTYVYSNDLTTRRRYGITRTTCSLLRETNLLGKDSWVMRNNAFDQLFVSGGDNQALFGEAVKETANQVVCDDGYTWAMQSVGSGIRRGRISFRADIRPPRTWLPIQGNGAIGTIMLGNDLLLHGDRFQDVRDFTQEFQIRFGVGSKNKTQDADGRMRDNKAFFYDGKTKVFLDVTLNHTHWYRFVATSEVESGKYDLKVYDLGTEHPELTTPTPENAIASVSNLGYRMPLEEDQRLSTLCTGFIGTRNEFPWEEDDPGLCLIDNVQIDRDPGLTVVVR